MNKKKKLGPGLYEKGNGKFIARFTYRNEDGKSRSNQETFSTLVEAKRWLVEMNAKRVLNQLPTKFDTVTIGQVAKLREEELMGGKYQKDEVAILMEIIDFFGADTLVRTMDDRSILRFIRYLERRRSKNPPYQPISNKTIWHRLDRLRSLLLRARDEGWIKKVPKIRYKKIDGEREITVTLESFHKTLENMEPPIKAMMLLCYFTGMRLHDLRLFEWDNMKDGVLNYKSTKTQRYDLTIPVPDVLAGAIANLPRDQQYVFANIRTNKPFGDHAIRRRITKACEEADVERWTPHQIRHLATMVGLQAGGEEGAVQSWIGWLDPRMVRRYGHPSRRVSHVVQLMDNALQDSKPVPAPFPGNVVPFRNLA